MTLDFIECVSLCIASLIKIELKLSAASTVAQNLL